MKKYFSIIIAMLLVLSAVAVVAQNPDDMILNVANNEQTAKPTLYDGDANLDVDDATGKKINEDKTEENAGLGPDSIFYGLELALERLRLSFTFNKIKKANLLMKYAEERLSEMKDMERKNKPEQAKKAAEKQEKNIREAEEALNLAEINGNDVSKEDAKLVVLKAKNIAVLSGLLEKLPEQAKVAVQKALEKSQEKRQNKLKFEKHEEENETTIDETIESDAQETEEQINEKYKTEDGEIAKNNEEKEIAKVNKDGETTKDDEESEVESENLTEVSEPQKLSPAEIPLEIQEALLTGEKYRCKSKIDKRVVLWYLKGDEKRVDLLGSPKEHMIYKKGKIQHWLTNTGTEDMENNLANSELKTFNELAKSASDFDCSKNEFSENLLLNPPAYVKFSDLNGQVVEKVIEVVAEEPDTNDPETQTGKLENNTGELVEA